VKRVKNGCLTLILIGLFGSLSFGQTKLAQTGFNFLAVSSDAQSSGMADAVTSLTGFSGAMSFNPASMAEMPTSLSANFAMNKWIADINYLSASVIISPYQGNYGNIGLSIQTVDYGDVEGTLVDRNNPNGYVETGVMNPSAYAIGLGYSKMISNQFGIGARVKYASQSLGENYFMSDAGNVTKKQNKADVVAYDFGTVYKTGVRSIVFGMSVTNFSKEIRYESEDFQLPLLFSVGISASVFELINQTVPNQALILAVDWVHPRSHPEQVKVGLDYTFMQLLSLRVGYVSGNDENSFTYGVGVASYGFGIDYSYTPFGVFSNVQRFTARFSI
jgi:hypothetical protein